MAKNKSWYRTDIDNAALHIGSFEFKIAQFTGTFALNEIPRATCILAVGRKTDGSNDLAEIHRAAGRLQAMDRAVVTWTPKGEADDRGNKWPEEETFIFDGYVAGFSYRKVQNKLQAVVHLIHWLSDMAFSSTTSRASHPSNPMDFIFKAANLKIGSGAAGGELAQRPVNISGAIPNGVIPTIPTDVWSAIKDIFCSLADRDPMFVLGPDRTCAEGVEPKTNVEAKNALELIEDTSSKVCPFERDINGNQDKFGVSAKFDGQLPVTFSKGVVQALGREGFDSYATTTFWDKLVGHFASQFLLAVVPMVGRALVVPWQPGSRPLWKKTIRPGEFSFIDSNAMLRRPMQSMNIIAGIPSRNGAPGFARTPDSAPQGVVGCYKPRDDEVSNRGVAHFLRAPRWLTGPLEAGDYVGATTGVKKRKAQPSATTPDATADQAEDPGPDQLRTQSEKLFDAYAQSLYVREALRGRTGEITGKLRFDIAPGSTVRLDNQPERFAGAGDQLAVPLVGHVLRVTVNIDSESRNCTTSYKVAFVRSIAENGDDRFSVEKPPLYSEAFAGAPLIPEYLFE